MNTAQKDNYSILHYTEEGKTLLMMCGGNRKRVLE